MQVDVVIPSKTSPQFVEMTQKCIASLKHSERDIKFNVILIESERDNPPQVGQDQTIHWERDNFNYNGALNLGIAASKTDWVILCNNDLWFHPNWFSEILKVYNDYPDIESFSSWTSVRCWHEYIFGPDKVKEFRDYRGVVGYRTIGELAAWCLTVRRDLLTKINLRENVDFYYSDCIYVDELLKLKKKHSLVIRSKVDHLGHQTVRAQSNRWDLENGAQQPKYLACQTAEERENWLEYKKNLELNGLELLR